MSARVFSAVGLERATHDEMIDVHAIALETIGGDVADVQTLRRVQEHTGAVVFVCREQGQATGFLAWLPLTPDGLRALIDGTFNGLDPAPSHLCRAGEACAAAYGWGYAGRTRRAMATVIKAVVVGRRETCPEAPFFTRGATSDGARLLSGRLDCQPFPIDRPGLYWSAPLTPHVEAAE